MAANWRSWFKRKQKHVRIPAEIGTVVEFVDGGKVVATLYLDSIHRDRIEGTSIEFRELSRMLTRSRITF